MSPEVLSQVAAVAGGAVGFYAEKRAIDNAMENAKLIELEAATAAVAQSEVAAEASSELASQPSFGFRVRQRLGRSALAPLTMLVAGAAGMATFAYKQENQVVLPPTQPKLEMVVDHSEATNFAINGTRSIIEVNSLADQIAGKGIHGEALVASSGVVQAMPIRKVNKNVPFGFAPLEQATSLALDKSTANTAKGQDSVLVITNGNSVGDTKKLAEQAERDETPVFVVNVESADQTSHDLKDELEGLAKDTGGKYWEANKGNLSEVADSVQATLSPAEAKSSHTPKWPIIEFGAMLAVSAVGLFRRRSEYATLKDFKGE
ncbi:MAG TPA: hypothetical protein VHB72_02150 [Candidatus Saccharimonadales bacterium]|nr:hypothetical protein [Candidatus Saccharimonadales bacterium]